MRNRCAFVFVLAYAVVVGATAGVPHRPPSAQLSVCLESSSNEHRVRSFWQEAAAPDCALDPHRLMGLYRQLAGDSGQCGRLLLHQVRRTLLDTSVAIFEDALVAGNYANGTQALAGALFRLDPVVSRALYERLIDAVYAFQDLGQLAQLLAANPLLEQRAQSLLSLFALYNARFDVHPRLAPLMAGYLSHLRQSLPPQNQPELRRRVEKASLALPQSLRVLYAGGPVRLVNTHHWEHLYAPRDNGPDAGRRLPLTWIAEKNATDSDGVFEVQHADDSGDVAIGSRYGGRLCFLHVDEAEGRPYFLLLATTGVDDRGSTRWWQVRWHEEFLVLANAKTKQLLCAAAQYDENRRYVTVEEPLLDDQGMEHCRWLATA